MSEAKAKVIAAQFKPPTCPHCGKPIDHLIYYAWELVSKRFSLREREGKIEGEYYDEGTVDVYYGSVKYRCPYCDWTIATDYEDAVKFLSS